MSHETETDFKLGNPPIIEWWIRSTFVPPDDGQSWNWEQGVAFLNSYGAELPIQEKLPQFVPQADAVAASDTSELTFSGTIEPAYFRRRTKDRSKTLQIGEHELVVAHLRKAAETYPGFSELSDQFRDYLVGYQQTFLPASIDKIELHNVDLVVIPNRAKTAFELSEFIKGAPSLPEEPFGSAFDTSWTISFKCPQLDDVAHLQFGMLPRDGDDLRFRLDWHYVCQNIVEDSPDSVAERLNIAHTYLNSCFKGIFTGEVWNQFNPKPK